MGSKAQAVRPGGAVMARAAARLLGYIGTFWLQQMRTELELRQKGVLFGELRILPSVLPAFGNSGPATQTPSRPIS